MSISFGCIAWVVPVRRAVSYACCDAVVPSETEELLGPGRVGAAGTSLSNPSFWRMHAWLIDGSQSQSCFRHTHPTPEIFFFSSTIIHSGDRSLTCTGGKKGRGIWHHAMQRLCRMLYYLLHAVGQKVGCPRMRYKLQIAVHTLGVVPWSRTQKYDLVCVDVGAINRFRME